MEDSEGSGLFLPKRGFTCDDAYLHAQLFGGANGWPGLVLAVRKSQQGQPSLASTFDVDSMNPHP
jgi:hypothetical protein